MKQYWIFLIAILPIIWLIISLGVLKLKSYTTCIFTCFFTTLLAIIFWNMSVTDAVTAILEGFALAFWPILWVTIAAVFTYNVSTETGSMDKIKTMLSSVTTDKRVLVLLIAWGFGGFMEAIAGYGTAVAIPASILISLGFNPLFAVVICLVSNTATSAFGALGIPVITLANLTQLNVLTLGYTISLQLLIPIIIIPFILILITDKRIKTIKEVGIIALFSGLGFGIPQLFITRYIGPELTALLGSLISMLMTILSSKLFMKKSEINNNVKLISVKEGFKACTTFILLFIFVLLSSSLVEPVYNILKYIKTSITIYTGEGATPYIFYWIATPGTMIIIATLIGGRLQGLKILEMYKMFLKTVVQLKYSIVTVLAIVAFSKVLSYSGMTSDIAIVIANTTGMFYPAIAPVIGALGTFLTGSNTSANVLFGSLQTQVANELSINPNWLAAANSSGATMGKMISPQSLAIGTAAAGLPGSEGKILNIVIKYCALFIVILGVIVFIGSLLSPSLS